MRSFILLLSSALAAALPASASSIDWTAGAGYTYDAAGNIRQIAGDHHVYDAAGRLVQSDTSGIRRNYEYDGFGNRTKCEQPGTDCQYGHGVIPATNRLNGLTYDGAGNVTAFEGHHYDYDLLNLPASRDLTTEYVYTAGDERIAVYTPAAGAWRWTLRDASAKVVREMSSHNGAAGEPGAAGWTWTRDYVWRGEQLLASRQLEPGAASPATYHYHVDHLGTPRRITSDSDTIVGVHDYHAFGPETGDGTNEPSVSPIKFTGHERDVDPLNVAATLDYMHARYYSGTLGRFMSVDPGQDHQPQTPQSWNLYAYARNNPIGKTDPDGRRVHSAGVSATVEGGVYLCVEVNLNMDMRGNVSLTSSFSLGGGGLDAGIGPTVTESYVDTVHDLQGISPTVGLLGQEITPDGSGHVQQFSLGKPSPLEAHGGAELTTELASFNVKTVKDNVTAAVEYLLRDKIDEAKRLLEVLRPDGRERSSAPVATTPEEHE